MNTLTIVDALDLIDHMVDQMGVGHTAHPTYLHPFTRQPECMIAHVMMLAGVEAETINHWNNMRFEEVMSAGLCPIPVTMGAVAVLRAAQRAQDGQHTTKAGLKPGNWGEARTEALRAAKRYLELFPDRLMNDTPDYEKAMVLV